ncbi:MAG: PD-(D/E)XK nuclease family protein, partial [Methylocystis sp.]|nr:PD-(D/E)XK nuclease family protein [Methylocystis sp.]
PAARGEIAVQGRIDRLAETERDVFVADFKTGGPRPDGVAPEQLRQLAIYRAAVAPLYPGKTIRAILIWTQIAKVFEPDANALDTALAEILKTA